MGAEHLIYCPMFLRCTFHDVGREILRHILRHMGASPSALELVVEVVAISLPRGFGGVKRALGYPCLVRESAPTPVFEGFSGA